MKLDKLAGVGKPVQVALSRRGEHSAALYPLVPSRWDKANGAFSLRSLPNCDANKGWPIADSIQSRALEMFGIGDANCGLTYRCLAKARRLRSFNSFSCEVMREALK